MLKCYAGCGERGPFDDQAYQASSAIQPASWARLNTSEPSASLRAWCADPDVAESYVQIDLGKKKKILHAEFLTFFIRLKRI